MNRFIQSIHPVEAPILVDNKNSKFKELHCTVDAYFHLLQVDGVGTDVKHASVISKKEENLLWKKEVLSASTPLGLLRAVFFL